uniref:GCR055 n=1 Tax=Schmidtea mediterranea TaxID=79327 RepID=A0A193KUH3_SCHMD|nr:GCR055 [Schmidtea mediterranea]
MGKEYSDTTSAKYIAYLENLRSHDEVLQTDYISGMNSSGSDDWHLILDYVVGYSNIVFLIMGTIGNLLIIIISSRQKTRPFTKLFIVSEAVWDLAILLLSSIRYAYNSLYSIEIRNHNLAMCKSHSFLTYFFNDISSWVLMILSIERFLLLKYPTNSKLKSLTVKHASVITVILLGLSFVKNFLHFLSVYDETDKICIIYSLEIQVVISYVDLVFNAIIPFIGVAMSTIGTLILLRIHNQKLSENVSNSSRTSSAVQVLKMVLAISIYNFITAIPQTILSIILSSEIFNYDEAKLEITFLFFRLSLLFYISNNAIKFYLYIFVSTSYRKMLLYILKFSANKIEDFTTKISVVMK